MIIDLMTKEALIFMAHRKKIEEKRKKEMLSNASKMLVAILSLIKSLGSISVSNIPQVVQNEIKPIIDQYRNIQHNYVDSFIRDDMEVGNKEGQKLLELANEQIIPLSTTDKNYQEVLAALLLYAERVVDSIHDDLQNNLMKDITSIYISSKTYNDYKAEKEIDTDNNSTLNTILSGTIISKYINPTFKNINNRTGLTAKNESNRSLNHGLLMAYLTQKNNNKDFSKLAVKWIDANDERECKYCRAAANGGDEGDGVYNIGDVTPPPLHSSCRCILIPYLSRWEV